MNNNENNNNNSQLQPFDEAKARARNEQNQKDFDLAFKSKAVFWAETTFNWQARWYQVLLLGCFDRVYTYPDDFPVTSLRGKPVNKFTWRIGRQNGKSEVLAIGALYLALCKPIHENKWKSKRDPNDKSKVIRVKQAYKRGANIILASADADKAKTVFDRVMKFLTETPKYALAMEQNLIQVKKHPFPTIEFHVPGWVRPASIMFRGPGAKGQALRSKTFEYKLYDEADYMPEAFFEAELATEINAKNDDGKSHSFVVLSSTPTGKRQNFYNCCFTANTKVLLADNTFKSIQDIQIGNLVYNRYGKPEPVTYTFELDYKGSLVEFKIPGDMDYVQATPEHRVMSIKRSERYCGACDTMVWHEGMECMVYNEHLPQEPLNAEYRHIHELNVGDYVVIPTNMAKTIYGNEKSLEKFTSNYYWTEDFVYVPIVHYEKKQLTKEESKDGIKVYNLTVGEDHSYNVNGFGVANCTDVNLAFKEFHFSSWENPKYDDEMNRQAKLRLTNTAYQHEIMADWGTVEMGVFDWTYFERVFSYKYKMSEKTHDYEYRNISINADDIARIKLYNMSKYLTERMPALNGLAKYYFGADPGYSADPSEFIVFEEFNGVMKMVLRVHMEHITYEIQADMVAFLDNYFKFEMLGMDAGNAGIALAQMLMSRNSGYQRYATHRFDIRLIPVMFNSSIVIDKINGEEIKGQAKREMTNMIIKQAENQQLYMPGLQYDADIENQFRNHTYSTTNGQVVYSSGTISPDHVIDAVRTCMYARLYSMLYKKNRNLPNPSTFRARSW